MKTALITGITGQDGAYLAQLLLKKKYKVYGTLSARKHKKGETWRLDELKITDKVKLVQTNYSHAQLNRLINRIHPDEIYNLASQNYRGVIYTQPFETIQINAFMPSYLLEIIRNSKRKIKFFQASSVQMYDPISPYAASKLFVSNLVKQYRENYGIFACQAVLFNHESELRGPEFVTRAISISAARIKMGLQKKLVLKYIYAKRDWGYAPEYVECMYRMMQHSKADDFELGTGRAHSVREFAEVAFRHIGLNYKKYLDVKGKYQGPREVKLPKPSSKAFEKLGWKPKTTFEEIARKMVDADLKRLRDRR
ncbi:MAG: GDP-mannose 4,6-dehydratase [Candidatus Micrarchaeota archaeon]|nr:GDP-mannose 4,6-dehydratase [Candidatus Micrarchaeota archaeon]